MPKQPFPDVLNDCLDRLAQGQSVDDCVTRYPRDRELLAPLLETATKARLLERIKPRPEFKAAARARLEQHLAQTKRRWSIWGRLPIPRAPVWASALLVVFVVFGGGGGGVVWASSGSTPDQPLYPVKLATEHVRKAVTFSSEGKASLEAQFADRRAEELAEMASKNKPERVQELTTRLNEHLRRVPDAFIQPKALPGEPPPTPYQARIEMQRRLRAQMVRNRQVIEHAYQQAPPSEQPQIYEALVSMEQGYVIVIIRLGGSPPPPKYAPAPTSTPAP